MNVQQGDLKGAALTSAAGRPASERAGSWMPPSVFTPDLPTGPDHLGRSNGAAFLAEVIAHRGVGTPLCIGLFGPSGSGKSSLLAATLAAVERLNRAAEEAGLATPFHAKIVVARVDAGQGGSLATALMRQVSTALATAYPRLVGEAAQAGLDPRSVVRQAAERANEARRQLDTERAALEALTSRHARLTETVLFDSAGSGVDSFARGNRGRIERSLRRFGHQGDPLHAYKEAVREASEAAGPVARATGWLRAFWAYRGQGRLLVLAAALLLAAWGLGALIANETKLVAMVQGGGDKTAGLADWLQAQWHWLRPAKRTLELAALAALAINLWRGLRFLQPIHRGIALLRSDLDGRRRDLDTQLAHQTRRVDALAREAEHAAAELSEAEGRLAVAGLQAGPVAAVAPNAGETHAARSFFAFLAEAIQAASNDRLPANDSAAPARIVIGVDGFDHLPSGDAATMLQTARALLDAPGFVTIVAADRSHLAAGLAEADPALATARLTRLVQIPYAVGGDEAWPDSALFARALLDVDPRQAAQDTAADASVSALDRPWSEGEGAVIDALAPFAGSTPRVVKRFVNLYRVARADPLMRDGTEKDLAVLALNLALQTSGTPADLAAYGMDEDASEARKAVGAVLGSPLVAQDGGRGFDTAHLYSMGR